MDGKKFEVVTAIPLGTLDQELRSKWDALYELQREVSRLQQEFELKAAEFRTGLEEKFGAATDGHGLIPNYRVDENNVVAMQYCECPPCQAELHNMTVVETVEAMYRSNLIPPEEIDEAREFAKEADLARAATPRLVN